MDFHNLREDTPASYPEVDGLSLDALALSQDMIWLRLEAYVAWRWSPRSSVWLASGEAGEQFRLPLAPVSDMQAERWNRETWETYDLLEGPFGYILPCRGNWRFTATIGANVDLPATVAEAFRRYAEYVAASSTDAPGAHRMSSSIGPIEETFSQSPSHIARALVNSGAADLLRPYRRA